MLGGQKGARRALGGKMRSMASRRHVAALLGIASAPARAGLSRNPDQHGESLLTSISDTATEASATSIQHRGNRFPRGPDRSADLHDRAFLIRRMRCGSCSDRYTGDALTTNADSLNGPGSPNPDTPPMDTRIRHHGSAPDGVSTSARAAQHLTGRFSSVFTTERTHHRGQPSTR